MNLLTLIFGYFFSISFFLFGFLILFISPLSGFLILSGSALIFPKFTNQIKKFFWLKIGKNLPKFSLGAISFVLFFSSILVFSSPNTGQNGEVKGVNSSQNQSSSSQEIENLANNSEIFSENLAKSTEISQETAENQKNSANLLVESPKNTVANTDDASKSVLANNEEAIKSILSNTENPIKTDKKLYQVLEVVDGDTIKISEIGTLRLIGIDTPETKDPRKVVQCFGVEASNNAKKILSGQKVYLEYDKSKAILDKYQRTLAYVFREDGYFYNLEVVKNGFAHSYKEYPHPRLDEFNLAENNARSGKVGFWADNTCSGNTEQGAGGEVAKVAVPPTGGTQEKAVEVPKTGNFDSNGDGKVTCADFKGQVRDPNILALYPKLDGNSDGVGCESNR